METTEKRHGPGRLLGGTLSVLAVAALAWVSINLIQWASGVNLWSGDRLDGFEGMGWILLVVLLSPLQQRLTDFIRAKERERRLRG